MPWRNGLGVTTEVLVQPPDASAGFAWRISVATITRAGPFSPFPGYDRTILARVYRVSEAFFSASLMP